MEQKRSTKQRTAMLAVLQDVKRPLTPQEVLMLAQQDVPALGIATVYRNLKVLMEEGSIRMVELPGEAARYEAIHHEHDDHHHHFLCTQCTRAFDVHGCAEDFASLLPPGFKVKSHEITLYGLCADCVKAEKKKKH